MGTREKKQGLIIGFYSGIKHFIFLRMGRICVLCLGNHASFECSRKSIGSKTSPKETTKKKKRQASITGFCSHLDNPLTTPNLPRATPKVFTIDEEVIFVKAVLPARPIPLILKQEELKREPSVGIHKSTETIIGANQLITLEEHEAILKELLSEKKENTMEKKSIKSAKNTKEKSRSHVKGEYFFKKNDLYIKSNRSVSCR